MYIVYYVKSKSEYILYMYIPYMSLCILCVNINKNVRIQELEKEPELPLFCVSFMGQGQIECVFNARLLRYAVIL